MDKQDDIGQIYIYPIHFDFETCFSLLFCLLSRMKYFLSLQGQRFFFVKNFGIMFNGWKRDSLSMKIQQSLIRANKFGQFPRGINTLLQSVWSVKFDDSWYNFYDSVLYLYEIYDIKWRKLVRIYCIIQI